MNIVFLTNCMSKGLPNNLEWFHPLLFSQSQAHNCHLNVSNIKWNSHPHEGFNPFMFIFCCNYCGLWHRFNRVVMTAVKNHFFTIYLPDFYLCLVSLQAWPRNRPAPSQRRMWTTWSRRRQILISREEGVHGVINPRTRHSAPLGFTRVNCTSTDC